MPHAGFPHPLEEPRRPQQSGQESDATAQLTLDELTRITVDGLLEKAARANAIEGQPPPQQRFMDDPNAARGDVPKQVETPEYKAYLRDKLQAQDDVIYYDGALRSLGFDLLGNPLSGGPGGGATAGQLLTRQNVLDQLEFEREREVRIREVAAAEQESIDRRFADEQDRLRTDTAISTVSDQLEASIARGEIGRLEADRRFKAAVEAAGIQRDVLSDFGGRNLPAGTEFFPGFEPGSAFANVVNALPGFTGDFGGFGTGGTFGVNPNALGQNIVQSAQGSVLPGLNAEAAAAAALFQQLGQPGLPVSGAQQQQPAGIDPTAQMNAIRSLAF